MGEEKYKQEIREVMWDLFFNEDTMDGGLKDELSWRKKDGYYAIQDFLFACEKLSREFIDKYYAIDHIDKKYVGFGAYENVYNDLKNELKESIMNYRSYERHEEGG